MKAKPPDWTRARLDDLGTVSRGRSRHRPRNDSSLYGGQYPFVQTSDIKSADLYLRTFEQTYNETGLAQSRWWKPGTLCITIAANIAETAILGIAACFPDSIVGFTSNPKKSNVIFVKYSIDFLKLRMQNISRGTTQDNLSVDKLLSFDFLVPPLPIQRKIVVILSAYDDLIESNLRRIRILEEMAQALYREWFVEFRFPGQEGVRLVDSPLGKIPKGWEVAGLQAVASLRREKFLEPRDSDLPLLDLARIPSKSWAVGEFGGPSELSTSRICFEKGDVLFGGIRPYLHKTVIAPCPGVTNVSVHVLVPKRKEYAAFLGTLCFNDSTIAWADKHSTGTKMPVISWGDLSQMPLVLPPAPVAGRFQSMTAPKIELVSNLISRNLILRRTRDLLLPRLISGELDVSDLDIAVPEAAA